MSDARSSQRPNASVSSLLRDALRQQPAGMATLVFIMLVEVFLSLAAPWPMKWLIDHAILGQPAPAWLASMSRELMLIVCATLTIALFALGSSLNVIQSIVSLTVGQKLVYGLASRVYGHLTRLSLRFHTRNPIGDSIRRIGGDCGCATTILRDCALPMVGSALTLIGTFAIAAAISWPLAIIAIVAIPPLLLAMRHYAGPIADRSYAYSEAEAGAYERVERGLSTVQLSQLYSREAAVEQGVRQAYDATLAGALDAAVMHQRLKIVAGAITAIAMAGTVWLGAWQVIHGSVSVGTLWVLLAYVASVYSPLESLVDSSGHIRDAIGSARRVLEVLNRDSDVAEKPEATPLKLRSNRGARVEFDQVSLAYDPGRDVLRGLSLSIAPGEVIALVGASGAGKTTLLSLVPRLFDPTAGRVTIDGHDLRDHTLESIRRRIGIVLQQPFLFPMSIADNIAYGRPEATRADVEAAAKAAGADDFIRALEGGYDAVVGERGATLSGGQRQRISIARALLVDPPVLLLDEPTSALDSDTEQAVLDGLRLLLPNRTAIVVAHRLSTARLASRIVVLRDGQISEMGTHDELLALHGEYARYFNLQNAEARHE
jgi:ATP-binding cassette subfamily B protein/subfamily B ATP-binding cassette protein MsbA